MKKIEDRFREIREFCRANANPEFVKKYSRYFTEGYDAYGLDPKIFEAQRDYWLEKWKNDLTIDEYILLGDKLISTGKYEEASFAVSFIYSNTDKLTAADFERLGYWLEHGIVNWAQTDVLSGRALSHFFINNIVRVESLNGWIESSSKWKRRAVPVTLIETLNKDVKLKKMFEIIDPLMTDSDKFVQKGLGWFLREAWKRHPEETEAFLLKWKDTCGRTIVQYATEKMDKINKERFRKEKK